MRVSLIFLLSLMATAQSYALELESPVKDCSYTPGTGKDYIFRRHPLLGIKHQHSGVDLSAPEGTPYYAPGDGVITAMGKANGRCGYIIEIRHSPQLYTHSCHLKPNGYAKGLKVGSTVRQGELLAQVGNSGKTSGPHSHFVVKSQPGFSSHMDPYKVVSEFCGVSRAQARGVSASSETSTGGTQ